VDAVSSILYLDYGRDQSIIKNKDGGNVDYEAVEFLKALNAAVLGPNPGVITIAEESTVYPLVTMPPDEGGLGFTFKWNMGFMHDTLDYMMSDPFFRHGAHDKMTFSMSYAFSENYILPYSHDEVVHGKKSLIDKMYGDYEEKFAALKTLFGWQYGHPGKKLMFMGCEFAQFIEWDYQKELDWFLLEYKTHAGVLEWVSALNKRYKECGALYSTDDGWDGFKWLCVDDRENNIFAFMRSGVSGAVDPDVSQAAGLNAFQAADPDVSQAISSDNKQEIYNEQKFEHIVCIYNFSVTDFTEYDIALPLAGKLRLLLASEKQLRSNGKRKGIKKVAAVRKMELNGLPYQATFVLPKSSCLFYSFTPDMEVKKKRS
jgi:1,4-alpha-glucan branching enzyme